MNFIQAKALRRHTIIINTIQSQNFFLSLFLFVSICNFLVDLFLSLLFQLIFFSSLGIFMRNHLGKIVVVLNLNHSIGSFKESPLGFLKALYFCFISFVLSLEVYHPSILNIIIFCIQYGEFKVLTAGKLLTLGLHNGLE